MEKKNKIGNSKSPIAGVSFLLTASLAAVQFIWWFKHLGFGVFEVAPSWSIYSICCVIFGIVALFLVENEKQNKKAIIAVCILLIVIHHFFTALYALGLNNPPEMIMWTLSYPLNIGLAIGAIVTSLKKPAISSHHTQALSRSALQD
jgi:hypothetical protein